MGERFLKVSLKTAMVLTFVDALKERTLSGCWDYPFTDADMKFNEREHVVF